jgi:superfamily II DNA or RNA helicase
MTSISRTGEEQSFFDADDIARAFTATTAQRGRAYQQQGRVRDVEISSGGAAIDGLVVGSRRQPYRVEITVLERDDQFQELLFETDCTCHVGVDCKHAAAVLFEVLARGRHVSGTSASAPQRPSRPPRPADPLAGPVAAWLGMLAESADESAHAAGKERVIYILDLRPFGHSEQLSIDAAAVRSLKTGGYGRPRRLQLSTLVTSNAEYVRAEDRAIARLLTLESWRASLGTTLPDDPILAEIAMRRLIASGRCHWRSKDASPLTVGECRSGRVEWRLGPDGRQNLLVAAGSAAATALPGAALWYVDTETMSAGPLDLGLPAAVVSMLLKAPPVSAAQVPALSAALSANLRGYAIPAPAHDVTEEVVCAPPVPCLHLASHEVPTVHWYDRPAPLEIADVIHICFDYGGTIFEADTPHQEICRVEGRRVTRWRRDQGAERAARHRFESLGLVQEYCPAPGRLILRMSDPSRWPVFVHRELPQLVAEGWRVELTDSFRHRVIDASGEWEAEVTEERNGGWWFSLDLGIEVEGKRVALLPLLVQALKAMRDLAAGLTGTRGNDTFYARLDAGRVVALPFERVAPLVSVLVELFDAGAVSTDGRLDLSLGEAMGLAEIEAAMQLRWLGGERLRRLASRLATFDGAARAAFPAGFVGELPPYQRQGLDWLQFLREYELGGILADDMGLGKTVQALAHILTEKRAGRLERPCLVVCPTTLVPNWTAEAARFAPELVVSLHGSDRATRFGSLAAADLALTTYALLIHDEEALLAQDWHLIILDEAQAIKNPAAKVTGVACRLRARHRVCLTGTPVENHLGDIWSQFAFLMPGLLGDVRRFARVFRTPIEKKGDAARQALLARRLRPFILRRTKVEVAAELPPKTVMVRHVELAGAQRDLYETVRLAMHEKVRRAIAERGLARSHIVILEALLKLRQACCDPRLVKLTQARRVTVSAKLDHLKEMLPELIEEGRRVLIFSQFTSMLDLIEAELDTLGFPYVDLRGDTLDRATPVARFQAREVPLFCLRLKAGGAGLNLTAADTVIHYDPWWNPAVEAQATDRAHRIGQDKPVFIYKLIAEGTIEDRMLELQDKKAALANGLFDPDRPGGRFEVADLDLLFQPLI